MMTVGDLRRALEGQPDDRHVQVCIRERDSQSWWLRGVYESVPENEVGWEDEDLEPDGIRGQAVWLFLEASERHVNVHGSLHPSREALLARRKR